MTKTEWKTQYSAARLLKNSRQSRYDESQMFDRPEQRIVWDIVYDHIQTKMHKSIGYAVFGMKENIFPLKKHKWAAKHNSMCFQSVRIENYLSKLSRSEIIEKIKLPI